MNLVLGQRLGNGSAVLQSTKPMTGWYVILIGFSIAYSKHPLEFTDFFAVIFRPAEINKSITETF